MEGRYFPQRMRAVTHGLCPDVGRRPSIRMQVDESPGTVSVARHHVGPTVMVDGSKPRRLVVLDKLEAFRGMARRDPNITL